MRFVASRRRAVFIAALTLTVPAAQCSAADNGAAVDWGADRMAEQGISPVTVNSEAPGFIIPIVLVPEPDWGTEGGPQGGGMGQPLKQE